MLDDYRTLAVFVAVADAGGFSQAGRSLKLSTSVISHHIGRLEEKLGVSLFFRTTRSMSLTPEGERMLEPARRMVASGQEAMDTLADFSEQPIGDLRLTLPVFGVDAIYYKRVWAFANEHPLVAVSLEASDLQLDLVKSGFDLALRFGELTDSSLKSCRVGDFQHILVATPTFLRNWSTISSPEDLRAVPFVYLTMLSDGFQMIRDQHTIDVTPMNTRIEVNSIAAAKSAILANLGIQRLPASEVQQELNNGVLERVLADWSLPVSGVYAVWPNVGPQKKLTRRLIDYLMQSE